VCCVLLFVVCCVLLNNDFGDNVCDTKHIDFAKGILKQFYDHNCFKCISKSSVDILSQMPWHHVLGERGCHYGGFTPHGAIFGWIRMVVPVGHRYCGCYWYQQRFELFWPSRMLSESEDFLDSHLAPCFEPSSACGVSYGWIWPRQLGRQLQF
jgi:hypothetical protein